jgi:hypothetical protein
MGKLDSMFTRVNISIVDEKRQSCIPCIAVTLHLESFLDFLLLDEKYKEEEVHVDRLE